MTAILDLDLDREGRDEPPMRKAGDHATEAILLAMAVLSPWAFGAVDAWAELWLEAGVVGLAILGVATNRGPGQWRRWLCSPSLAIVGLAVLSFSQTIPLPVPVVRTLAKTVATLRDQLVPHDPQTVAGDPEHPVAAPLPTLSLEPEAALQCAAALAAAWIVFQAVLGLRGGPATFRRFGLAMAGNAVALTLFSVAQAMTWDGKIYGIRRTEIGQGWYSGGPFVCHNHLAAYLNLGLGFALGLLLGKVHNRGKLRAWRLWPAYMAAVIVVGVLASHSRGGFLAMLAALVVTVVAMKGGAWRGLLAMVAMAAMFLVAIGNGSAIDRVGTILDSGASGLNGRMEVWGVALRTSGKHPLVGTGLGSFAFATSPGFDHDRGVYFSHAENEPLQMLVEGGVVGLGLLVVCVVGMARLGRKALSGASSSRDRAVILGGLAGGLAVIVQSLGDFAMRIPGVAVAALILAAHLCRMGLAAEVRPSPGRQPSRIARGLVVLATILVSLLVFRLGFDRARSEASVVSAGLPPPGARMPDFASARFPRPDLEQMKIGLERALRFRPDWCEGHLRLGITLMALYEAETRQWLAEEMDKPEDVAILSDPLQVHAVVHASKDPDQAVDLALSQDPVLRFLVPAARSFLEARRSCPVAAMAHAGLGGLDYLVEDGEAARVHAARALRLSGLNGPIAARAGRIAGQAGDLDLAVQCWRRAFVVGLTEVEWAEAATAAAAALPPEILLDRVVDHSGRDTLGFACLVFADPEDTAVRERFLRAALDRLKRDPGPRSEKSWREGQAFAWLGDRERARPLMRTALEAEPRRGEWREEFIDWLIGWGEIEEAHRQAVIGVAIDPHRASACSTLNRVIAALSLKATTPIGKSRASN